MKLVLFNVFLCLLILGRIESLEEGNNEAGQDQTTLSPVGQENLVTSDQVVFGKKMYRCAMYSDKCLIDVFLYNSTKLKDLVFLSGNEELFKVEWVRRCRYLVQQKGNRTCSLKESFFKQNPNDTQEIDLDAIQGAVYTVKIEPIIFGKARLYVMNHMDDEYQDGYETTNQTLNVELLITQPRRFVDELLDVWVYIFQTFISLTMGILIDTTALWKIVKMPVPVIFGVSCQYIMMPLITLAYIFIFKLTPLESLSLFIYGCSPGGAASNNWTILFDGDIDLSAILTFVSTMTALGTMPAWVYSVGSIFMKQANLRIPFLNMLRNLAITIGPCILGVILSYFFPILKKIFAKIAKPMTMLVLISFLVLILYSRWYIFGLFQWKDWVVGPLVPCTGFLVSFLAAWICRFPIKQAKTISIETGIQNAGVAFIIILSGFPSPESDYAVLPLISVALMTNVPLYSTYFVYRFFKNRKLAAQKKRDALYKLAPTDDVKENAIEDKAEEVENDEEEKLKIIDDKEIFEVRI